MGTLSQISLWGRSVFATRTHGPCSAQTMQIFKIYENREMCTAVVMQATVLLGSTLLNPDILKSDLGCMHEQNFYLNDGFIHSLIHSFS